MDHTQHHERDQPRNGRWRWALAGFLLVAGFFLWTEHRAHLLGYLPYLLILACPLMHMFHHGSHGHGRQHPGDGPRDEGKPQHHPGAPS